MPKGVKLTERTMTEENKPLPKQLPELDAFADQVGCFIKYWGFKKIHGRIWTHLYLSTEPLDATTLTQRLGTSKALISISIKELLEYSVILESPKRPGQKQTYQANPNILAVILNVIRTREKKMFAHIEGCFNLLKTLTAEDLKTHHIDPKRIKVLDRVIKLGQKFINLSLKLSKVDLQEWKQVEYE